jgi:hypothetical protein
VQALAFRRSGFHLRVPLTRRNFFRGACRSGRPRDRRERQGWLLRLRKATGAGGPSFTVVPNFQCLAGCRDQRRRGAGLQGFPGRLELGIVSLRPIASRLQGNDRTKNGPSVGDQLRPSLHAGRGSHSSNAHRQFRSVIKMLGFSSRASQYVVYCTRSRCLSYPYNSLTPFHGLPCSPHESRPGFAVARSRSTGPA